MLIIFNCPLFAYKIVLSACADSLLSRIVDYTRTLVGLYFLFVCNVKLLLPPRTRAFFFVSILLTVDCSVFMLWSSSRLRATVLRFFAFRYLTKSHATVTEFTMIPMRLPLVWLLLLLTYTPLKLTIVSVMFARWWARSVRYEHGKNSNNIKQRAQQLTDIHAIPHTKCKLQSVFSLRLNSITTR